MYDSQLVCGTVATGGRHRPRRTLAAALGALRGRALRGRGMNDQGAFTRRRTLAVSLLAIAALALAGCHELQGGGTIASSDDLPGHMATFGFAVSAAEDGTGRLNGSYNDRYAPDFDGGVRLRFEDLVLSFNCDFYEPEVCADLENQFPELELERCVFGSGAYVSTNPREPGEGLLRFAACDGPDGNDFLDLFVYYGPYEDYQNDGPVLHGNLTAPPHDSEEPT